MAIQFIYNGFLIVVYYPERNKLQIPITKYHKVQGRKKKSVRKVVGYALGEIVLVVIGILIAVNINNWNSNQKEKSVEQVTLDRLKEDLQKDMHRFDFLDSALSVKIEMCDSIKAMIRRQTTIQDRIDLMKVPFMNYFLIEPNRVTYDEMRNTGRLYSLSNPEIRNLPPKSFTTKIPGPLEFKLPVNSNVKPYKFRSRVPWLKILKSKTSSATKSTSI